jgi:hypothetical protein
MMTYFRMLPLFGVFILAFSAGQAQAGVFNVPHFVNPGKFAVGLEPELTLTNGAGIGINAKYQQGLTDLTNFTAILGTGSGPRRFRAGGNMSFDFFPDLEGQPGIGVAVQAMYVRLVSAGQLELTGIPYIHKSYVNKDQEIEPFFSFPVGMAFTGGNYKGTSQAVIGSFFKHDDHLRYVLEVGIAVSNTESYVSGGIIYYQ